MRSMVEGPTLATIHDEPQGCVQVLQDIASSDPQSLKTKLGKHGIASLIALRLVTSRKGLPVNFDG